MRRFARRSRPAAALPGAARATPALAAVALVAALLLLPQGASAQLRVQLGGGLANPSGDFGDVVDSGYQGRAGLRLGFPLFPLSFQAEGEVSRYPLAALSEGDATILGGNVSAVLGLGGLGISPYLIAGVGSYRTDFSDEFDALDATTDVGYHGGLGVDLGFLGFGGFLEARYVSIDRDAGDVRMIPVTLGIRF